MDMGKVIQSKKSLWPSNPHTLPSNNLKKNEACVESCVCYHKRGLITCASCQKSFTGRIAKFCPEHPEIAFLMDARNCGFCGADKTYLKMSDPE